ANLGPGSYRVRLVTPAGTVLTTPAPADVAGVSGQDVSGLRFGLFRTITVSGRVFEDASASGNGAGTAGLAGITVGLFSAATGAPLAAALTGPDGAYAFANLGPGAYLVREMDLAGTLPTAPAGGTYTVTAQSGADVVGLDFG